jgi:predicted ATPase
VTLLATAAGNPLYAEEYVRMLIDRGHLRHEGDRWRLAAGAELPVPESVQGLIAARLDDLPAEEKRPLQDAAVVGKVSWLGALAAMSGGSRFAAEERLHALERREIVRRERRSSVGGEVEYAFRHVLVRDAAYNQIPRAQRAEKHRRAAEWSSRSRIARTPRTCSPTTTRRPWPTPATPASPPTSSSGVRGSRSATRPCGRSL